MNKEFIFLAICQINNTENKSDFYYFNIINLDLNLSSMNSFKACNKNEIQCPFSIVYLPNVLLKNSLEIPY